MFNELWPEDDNKAKQINNYIQKNIVAKKQMLSFITIDSVTIPTELATGQGTYYL